MSSTTPEENEAYEKQQQDWMNKAGEYLHMLNRSNPSHTFYEETGLPVPIGNNSLARKCANLECKDYCHTYNKLGVIILSEYCASHLLSKPLQNDRPSMMVSSIFKEEPHWQYIQDIIPAAPQPPILISAAKPSLNNKPHWYENAIYPKMPPPIIQTTTATPVSDEMNSLSEGLGAITLVEYMGSDATAVNAARVSFHKSVDPEAPLEASDIRLTHYLAKHHHIHPFHHAHVTLRIKMPLFVARQWEKHQIGFTVSEVSRRYVKYTPEVYIPTALRILAANVKQGSSELIHESSPHLSEMMQNHVQHSIELYDILLDKKICPEQARIILPQGMMTEIYETGSLAAWARLYKLRSAPDAQAEIRPYALKVGQILSEIYPVGWKALTAPDV